ncbi:MAG: sulfite exporter TauE/SafE family protein [Myxococcales bacterium]|nr:sulfite exporter TauE/SafE family protein [Myxococcales bacterium]
MLLPWPQLLGACLVVALATGIHGAVGFGAMLLAAPILKLIDPHFVPGPMLICGFFLALMLALREPDAVDLRGVSWALIGRLPGTGLGVLALALLPQALLGPAFGGLILLAVLLSASGLRLRPDRGTLFGAGLLSGVMGTVTSAGGPPVALVYQDASGARLRGTLSGYFIFSTAMSATGLALGGLLDTQALLLAALLLPAVVVGFLLSSRILPLVDRKRTRPAVLALSSAAGIAAIVKSF